jgi:hypothetical protein
MSLVYLPVCGNGIYPVDQLSDIVDDECGALCCWFRRCVISWILSFDLYSRIRVGIRTDSKSADSKSESESELPAK